MVRLTGRGRRGLGGGQRVVVSIGLGSAHAFIREAVSAVHVLREGKKTEKMKNEKNIQK